MKSAIRVYEDGNFKGFYVDLHSNGELELSKLLIGATMFDSEALRQDEKFRLMNKCPKYSYA